MLLRLPAPTCVASPSSTQRNYPYRLLLVIDAELGYVASKLEVGIDTPIAAESWDVWEGEALREDRTWSEG
jgi:hypothetical protein